MSAPAGFTALVAANIQDPSGALLAAGTLTVVPTDGTDIPIDAIAGGAGGALSTLGATFPIANGAVGPSAGLSASQTWAGLWSSIVTYAVGAVVKYSNGNFYGAILAGTNQLPTASSSIYWVQITNLIGPWLADTALTTPANISYRFVVKNAQGRPIYTVKGVQFAAAPTPTATFNFDTATPPGSTQAPYIPGPSAYNLAVANGFSGTLAQWLASLQGGVSTTALTFTGPGTREIVHGLGTTSPMILASVTSGAQRYSATVIDANTVAITTLAAMVATFSITGGSSTTGTAPTNAQIILARAGLIAAWQMADGPSSFADITTGADTLTGSNITTAAVTGLSATAAIFNGTNSVAVGTKVSNTNFVAGAPFSVSCWATFTNATGAETLVGNLDDSAGYVGWSLERSSSTGPMQFLIIGGTGGNVASIITSAALGAHTTPVHICATYDGSGTSGGMNMYINGALVSTTIPINSLGSAAFTSSKPVSIGARPNLAQPHTGAIADVELFSIALSSGAVATMFAQGAL